MAIAAREVPEMQWRDGHVFMRHPREPWEDGSAHAKVLAHARLDQVKGSYEAYFERRTEYQDAYVAAKFSFDLEAAYSIIERCVREEVVDAIADVVGDSDRTPRLVFPHPSFDDDDAVDADEALGPVPRNALPFAYAHYLGEVLGCDVDGEIVQAARVGRTKLGNWLRFLCQPTFLGVVERRPYILLDDVVSTCGTMTALRSHIVRNGGTVPLASALASTDGRGTKFGIAHETVDMLMSAYGRELRAYWSEAIGHDISCLSEAEGRFLLQALMGGAGKDPHDQSKLYSDSEIALIRRQLRVGNALARRAAKQRGYGLHPKLAANRQT